MDRSRIYLWFGYLWFGYLWFGYLWFGYLSSSVLFTFQMRITIFIGSARCFFRKSHLLTRPFFAVGFTETTWKGIDHSTITQIILTVPLLRFLRFPLPLRFRFRFLFLPLPPSYPSLSALFQLFLA